MSCSSSSRSRHPLLMFYWSSEVCSSDLVVHIDAPVQVTTPLIVTVSLPASVPPLSFSVVLETAEPLEKFSVPPEFFFQAEDVIRDSSVTVVQTCALPIFPVML